jgi:hypothetical protein
MALARTWIIFAVRYPVASQRHAQALQNGRQVSLFAGFAEKGECTIEANVIHYNEINVLRLERPPSVGIIWKPPNW